MTYDAERLREILLRLVGPGPKASHVSASETHEITDGCIELLDDLERCERELARLRLFRDAGMALAAVTELPGPEHVYDAWDAALAAERAAGGGE